jgi:hypothetical protein
MRRSGRSPVLGELRRGLKQQHKHTPFGISVRAKTLMPAEMFSLVGLAQIFRLIPGCGCDMLFVGRLHGLDVIKSYSIMILLTSSS